MNEWLILFGVIGGPTLVAWLTGRQRRQETERGYAREDLVAAQAAEAAALLLAAQHEAAEKAAEVASTLIENDAKVAEVAASTAGRIEDVHTLVNSSYTESKQDTLDETRSSLILMNELAGLHRYLGTEPSAVTLAAIEAKRAKITSLETSIADRLDQADAASADPV